MKEVSIILKSNVLITIEEFRILDKYSFTGRMWVLIQKSPCTVKQRTIEYIFDPETLTAFGMISNNILAKWETDSTKDLSYNDEFKISDYLYIQPYYKNM